MKATAEVLLWFVYDLSTNEYYALVYVCAECEMILYARWFSEKGYKVLWKIINEQWEKGGCRCASPTQ